MLHWSQDVLFLDWSAHLDRCDLSTTGTFVNLDASSWQYQSMLLVSRYWRHFDLFVFSEETRGSLAWNGEWHRTVTLGTVAASKSLVAQDNNVI